MLPLGHVAYSRAVARGPRGRGASLNFLGIDIGTSAAEGVLVDERQAILAEASTPVESRQPRPGWSDEDPRTVAGDRVGVASLARPQRPISGDRARRPVRPDARHLLLDAADAVIRPAIIWNDGRAVAECRELEAAVPACQAIAGVLAMPGFTAPKVLWLRRRAAAFARARRVILAKDYSPEPGE